MSTRLPYGQAKRIVAALEIGGAIIVRPEHMVAFHNAARRLGRRLAGVSIEQEGQPRFRMIRVADRTFTGHRACRLPRRDQLTGQWLRRQLTPAA